MVGTAGLAAAAAHWQPCAVMHTGDVVHRGLCGVGKFSCSSSRAAAGVYGLCLKRHHGLLAPASDSASLGHGSML